MLELSSKCKKIPFLLDKLELELTEFTVKDVVRLIELQKPSLDSGMTGVELMNDLSISRMMCSVKKADTDDYFWNGDIADFKKCSYPKNMIEKLVKHVDELNPISSSKLDTKKKSS